MTEEEKEIPSPPPAAPVDPDAALLRPDPDFDDPAEKEPGRRDGLGDIGRGMEFGVWFSALFSAPVVCALLGGSLGINAYAGTVWEAAGGMTVAIGRWIAVALVISVPIALMAGLFAWAYRIIAGWRGMPWPDRSARRRGRRRRWAVVAALGAAAMVSAALGMNHWLRKSVRDLRQATAETDAIDPDWRLDDLLATREEMPDDENSAKVVAKVFELLPDRWPPAGVPGEAAVPGYATAMERATDADDSRRLDEATVATIGAELEARRDALELARSLADYDRGRHELKIGPRVLDTLLHETQNTRTVARLLYADVILLAHDGELDEALDSCRAIIAAARSIGDEPFLISQLVRLAIDANAESLVRRALGQGEPSEEALAALQELLEVEREQPRLWWGLRGERAMLVEVVRRVMRDEVVPESLVGAGIPARANPSAAMIVLGAHQMAVIHRWCNELLEIPFLPEHEWDAAYAAWTPKLRAVDESWFDTATTAFPRHAMPNVRLSIDAEKRIRAVFGSLIILIAAERQRQATGSWPTSPAEIDPDILLDPPLDPYTGEPYRMRYADGRLRIYTFGPNRKDEGGAYDLKRWKDKNKLGRDDVGAYAYDPELRGRPAVAGEE